VLHELRLPIIIHPVVFLYHRCHLSNDVLTDLLPDVQQPLLIPPGPARILLFGSSELLADDPEHLLALKDVPWSLRSSPWILSRRREIIGWHSWAVRVTK
jgi:hypothetical protein